MNKPVRQKPIHRAQDFGLDLLSNDSDLFKWFLLCFLFGKPIRSSAAKTTWQLLIDDKIDTPWAIVNASDRQLVRILNSGGYTRYQHVTAHALHKCMAQLISEYGGSLMFMIESSQDETEFTKRLQELYGVGPKIVEIFTRETEEFFAQRIE